MGHQSVCFPRLQFAILASALLLLCLKNSQARFPEAEGGTFVRIEAETAVASATEEKDIAFNHLRRWGLGSQRQFAEVAGAMRLYVELAASCNWLLKPVLGLHHCSAQQPCLRTTLDLGSLDIAIDP